MISGFFKAVPNNRSLGEKPMFIWLNDFTEDQRAFIEFSIGGKFVEGCTLELANKEDEDFISYVNSDIKQVQKELNKLEILKNRLENALK